MKNMLMGICETIKSSDDLGEQLQHPLLKDDTRCSVLLYRVVSEIAHHPLRDVIIDEICTIVDHPKADKVAIVSMGALRNLIAEAKAESPDIQLLVEQIDKLTPRGV